MSATTTLVKVKCISKKESVNPYFNPQTTTTQSKIQTDISLAVPYDMASVFWQFSNQTEFVLKTTNQEAADMFIIGNDYDVTIAPSATE